MYMNFSGLRVEGTDPTTGFQIFAYYFIISVYYVIYYGYTQRAHASAFACVQSLPCGSVWDGLGHIQTAACIMAMAAID